MWLWFPQTACLVDPEVALVVLEGWGCFYACACEAVQGEVYFHGRGSEHRVLELHRWPWGQPLGQQSSGMSWLLASNSPAL